MGGELWSLALQDLDSVVACTIEENAAIGETSVPNTRTPSRPTRRGGPRVKFFADSCVAFSTVNPGFPYNTRYYLRQ
jgi:hypothetical protein